MHGIKLDFALQQLTGGRYIISQICWVGDFLKGFAGQFCGGVSHNITEPLVHLPPVSIKVAMGNPYRSLFKSPPK